LLQEGQIELLLPDGIKLEVGITKEGRNGHLEKCPDYCWVNTSQYERTAFIDSYNLTLGYPDQGSIILMDQDDDERKRVAVL
jgi:hypothetical protein